MRKSYAQTYTRPNPEAAEARKAIMEYNAQLRGEVVARIEQEIEAQQERTNISADMLELIEQSPRIDDAMRALLRTADSIEVNGYGCDGKEITQERFEFWGPDMQRQYIVTLRGNHVEEGKG